MKNTKILFILPEYYPHSGGGISTYYLHYIEGVKKHFEEVKVIVGSGYTQSNQSFEHNGILVEYLNPSIYQKYLEQFKKFDLFPNYKNNIAAAWAMWEQVEEGKGFDIIECVDFGLGFIPWLCKHTKPVIIRLHGSSGQVHLNEPQLQHTLIGDIYRQTEMSLLDFSDLLITHSTENRNYWRDIVKNVRIEMIYPIYFYNRPTSKKRIEKSKTGIVCGRIQTWKGPEVLCKALELKKNPDIKIDWYGRDTSYEGKLSLSNYLGTTYPSIWKKAIMPRQPLPHQEIVKLQAQAKYAIVPSTWDMFNFTVLEYMSIGTPVICSTGAGVAELVEDGKNGFKFDNYHANELAIRLEKIINMESAAYQQMIDNAYDTLETELSPEQQAHKNLVLYRDIVLNFKPRKKNSFVEQMFLPNSSKSLELDENLDQVSLRNLTKYILKRIKTKLLKR